MRNVLRRTLELSPALDAQLREFCEATNVSQSTVIRLALMSFLPNSKSIKGLNYASK